MKRVKRFFAAALAAVVLTLVLALGAQPAQAAPYPVVTNLQPFSAEANYMSLPGYLRYLVWARDGIWLTRHEAVAVVDRQIATGGD